MRNWIALFETTTPTSLSAVLADPNLKAHCRSMMDDRTVQTILEVYDVDDEGELANMWWGSCADILRTIERSGKVDIFRHMKVWDFEEFLEGIEAGNPLGSHWSIHYGTESPTWDQDQQGNIEVMLSGQIMADQIDWERTIAQMFEWPAEGELIFGGEVYLKSIENKDDDRTYKPRGIQYRTA